MHSRNQEARKDTFVLPSRTTAVVGNRQLALGDALVGEVRGVSVEDSDVAEAHLFLIARLAEESLAGPENDREDLETKLIQEVVFHQPGTFDDQTPVKVAAAQA